MKERVEAVFKANLIFKGLYKDVLCIQVLINQSCANHDGIFIEKKKKKKKQAPI